MAFQLRNANSNLKSYFKNPIYIETSWQASEFDRRQSRTALPSFSDIFSVHSWCIVLVIFIKAVNKKKICEDETV